MPMAERRSLRSHSWSPWPIHKIQRCIFRGSFHTQDLQKMGQGTSSWCVEGDSFPGTTKVEAIELVHFPHRSLASCNSSSPMQVRSRAQGLGPCWFDEKGSWDKKWARLRRTSQIIWTECNNVQKTTNTCQKWRNMQNHAKQVPIKWLQSSRERARLNLDINIGFI